MKKNMNKKIFTTLLITIFVAMAIIPSIQAGITIIQKTIPVEEKIETQTTIYDLLIITTNQFEKHLQPLKEHKEKYEVKTKIVTLTEVYDQMFWHGRDKPEKIKYFIKQAHEEWGIKYVMLVGGNKQLPVRYIHNQDIFPGYPEPYYISDLYYADLYDNEGNFSSWDSDGDAVFGEWKDDNESICAEDKDIDLYPDIYIGRLACKNTLEVRIMVDKIIKYESNTYGSEWFNRFVVVAGDTYPEGQYPFNTSGYEGEENTLQAIENMSDFEAVKMWISNGNFTGPKDIINIISQGCGFMFFEGHAGPMAWGTHPYNSHEFIYGLKNKHMWRLRNGYKLPIVVAAACHNGQFDITPLNLLKHFKFSLSHGDYGFECWAWKLTSKPFGGSIATISNTGLGMSKEDKHSMEGTGDFMDMQPFYIYGNNQSDILGEVWGLSIERYLDHFPIDWDTPAANDSAYDAKTVQEWVLFGDPSLKIGGYKPIETD